MQSKGSDPTDFLPPDPSLTSSLRSADAAGKPDTETQHRVFRVAAQLFSQRGFHAVSIRDIASASGVSVSTVLYGGRSKQQLLEEILARSFAEKSSGSAYLASFEPQAIDSWSALAHAYDSVIEALVTHAFEYPDTQRLWLRLLLDHPEMHASFEERYTWPLFQHAFTLLRAARDRGVIQANDMQIQGFVASLDWAINGYFAGGLFDFEGRRTDPTSPESVRVLSEHLRHYGRLWFADPTVNPPRP